MPAEIKSDYEAVIKQAKNRLASFYKRHVKLKLSMADINALTDKHIDSFDLELKRIFPDFTSYPSEVRLALFDLIFNVGMTDLNTRWPSLKKAVKEKDWAAAANESNRKKKESPISHTVSKKIINTCQKSA